MYKSHPAGQALKGRRDHFTLATKFGLVPHADGKGADVDGSPKHVREACEASLKRLQTDYIDLYYQHRVDRKVGIETTVREMKVGPHTWQLHTANMVQLHTLITALLSQRL